MGQRTRLIDKEWRYPAHELVTVAQLDRWDVVVLNSRGKVNMWYKKEDAYGRVYSSLSMMLTMEENERVIDLLEGREPTADMTPFKRRRVDTLTVYRWKYLDEDGNELKKSNETFLDKKECLGQGRVAREHGVLRWESSEVPIPTVEQLVKTVYAYMLERRVNQRCYGCIHDKSSPTDHMGGGCQGEKENVVYWHARPCHLRISSTLLWEAVNIMNEYFKIGRVDRCHVVLCLEHCHPKETFLKDDDDFYYEYYNLDEL